ncbi:hypothetical protein M0802_015411, partial [Mischocyttarus mexicanus]
VGALLALLRPKNYKKDEEEQQQRHHQGRYLLGKRSSRRSSNFADVSISGGGNEIPIGRTLREHLSTTTTTTTTIGGSSNASSLSLGTLGPLMRNLTGSTSNNNNNNHHHQQHNRRRSSLIADNNDDYSRSYTSSNNNNNNNSNSNNNNNNIATGITGTTTLTTATTGREVIFPDSFEVLPQPRDMSTIYMDVPHEQQRKFRCRFCGKGYRWKSTMRRHEMVECGGKPPAFQCPDCPYKARQRGNLTVHYKRHHID